MTSGKGQGICIEDGFYKLIAYVDDTRNLEAEASWAFRILRFLGAPKGFVVNWWRIDKPRILEPGQFPTRAEVNGGWAYHGRNEVWIFRLEEWDRVLIHECVHALNWDIIPSVSVKNCMEASIGGNLVDALFEAATEFIAEWLWCIIHSEYSDINGTAWTKQKVWQLNQTCQILARREKKWEEDTSVFAYYVLKTALAQDDEEFLIGWYSGKEDPDRWCNCWESYKKVFYHKALLYKDSVNERLSMRMTCPTLG